MNFSVIIPAYNCESTLISTINGILESGITDFEIILVDDGSKDGTSQLCDKLAQNENCIRCVHQKNAGASAARNKGIDESIGEYILFFDADDVIEKGALCHACEIIKRDNPDMLMFGMSFDYYHKGKLYRREEMVCHDEKLCSKEQITKSLEELFRCNYLSPVWNKFYRRAVIVENAVRFDENLFLMEDFLFSLDCMKFCETIYTLPEAIYRYIQTEDEKNAKARHAKIESLSEYVQPFEKCLESIDGAYGKSIINKLFFMLLSQRVRFESIDEIRKTAEDFKSSRYANVPEGGTLAEKLKSGEYLKIYLQNRKSIVRHRVAEFAKRNNLYR